MSIPSRCRIFAILLLVLVAVCCRAATPPVPDRAPGYVVDLANIIDSDTERRLEQMLRNLETATTAQMVILTLRSLDGQDIESFSLQTAEKWRIGQKGKDNGLLFTVAVADRKYRFETGYGLEDVLPDSLLGSLGRRALVPLFRRGKYGEGIAAATGEILRILEKKYRVNLAGVDTLPRPPAPNKGGDGAIFFFFVLLMMVIIISRRTNRRMGGRGPMIFPVGFGGGDWGSSGGFGGFSGGGGGFGGGGASGGW